MSSKDLYEEEDLNEDVEEEDDEHEIIDNDDGGFEEAGRAFRYGYALWHRHGYGSVESPLSGGD